MSPVKDLPMRQRKMQTYGIAIESAAEGEFARVAVRGLERPVVHEAGEFITAGSHVYMEGGKSTWYLRRVTYQ